MRGGRGVPIGIASLLAAAAVHTAGASAAGRAAAPTVVDPARLVACVRATGATLRPVSARPFPAPLATRITAVYGGLVAGRGTPQFASVAFTASAAVASAQRKAVVAAW